MSEAITAAKRAPLIIEQLITEMLEVNAEDNWIGLGELELNGKPLQIHLVVTTKQSDFLDDDLIMSNEE